MPDLLDRGARPHVNRSSFAAQRVTKGSGFGSGVDQRLARAELRRQIGRLERELGGLVAEGLGRVEVPHRIVAAGPPRILDLGGLERVRDSLATRVAEAHRALADRAAFEDANRELVEAMLAAPAEHRWVRVSRADLGLPGCGHWHSRPVLGPMGMLMGWWRVKVSSGCPTDARLAAARPETNFLRPPGARRPWLSWRSSPGSSSSRSASSARTRR